MKHPQKSITVEEKKRHLLEKKAGYMGAFSRIFRVFLKEGKPNTKHILPIFRKLAKYCTGAYDDPRRMFLGILKNEDSAWETFFRFADELRPGFLFDTRNGNILKRIPFEIVLKKRGQQIQVSIASSKFQTMDVTSFKRYLRNLKK
ncbi:hypothetical protein C4565_10245 [Candidatus Parcubacteria bacterium]|nr:MAG: hypothetical protein C4565_10245 [Candidatus Parcubacteria bacterium]